MADRRIQYMKTIEEAKAVPQTKMSYPATIDHEEQCVSCGATIIGKVYEQAIVPGVVSECYYRCSPCQRELYACFGTPLEEHDEKV
jgi:hypothetical protein